MGDLQDPQEIGGTDSIYIYRDRAYIYINIYMGVSENFVYPIVPNGFADHDPVFKKGYFIGKINPTFSDKAIYHPWKMAHRNK